MAVRATCDIVGTKYRRFNDFVRGELRRKKIQQSTLGEYLGVTQGVISQRLNGEIEWSFRDVLKTMEYFETKFEDIL